MDVAPHVQVVVNHLVPVAVVGTVLVDANHHARAVVLLIVLVDAVECVLQIAVELAMILVGGSAKGSAHSPAKALVEMLVVVNVQQVVVGTVGVIAWAHVDAVAMAHAKAVVA